MAETNYHQSLNWRKVELSDQYIVRFSLQLVIIQA